ncbi:hypothetical protein ACFL96_04420 [Thermoproteota archaeon]
MPDNFDTISSTIEKLAQKKNKVVTNEALQAKAMMDQERDPEAQAFHTPKMRNYMGTVKEFNNSIKLLNAIFKSSRFDEFAIFISNPGKTLLLNLSIGIIRGIGFAIGLLLIAALILYLMGTSLPIVLPIKLQALLAEVFLGA